MFFVFRDSTVIEYEDIARIRRKRKSHSGELRSNKTIDKNANDLRFPIDKIATGVYNMQMSCNFAV